jgi:hypothetical protein
MDKNEVAIEPKRKFDFLTLVIVFAFVGVLFSLISITFKRFPDLGIAKAFADIKLSAEVLFFIGLAFAVPAVLYIIFYIGQMLLTKDPTQKVALSQSVKEVKKAPAKLEFEYDDLLKLEPDVAETEETKFAAVTEMIDDTVRDDINTKVAKEAIKARIREIEKQLSAEEQTKEPTADNDIYIVEDEYAREVPKEEVIYEKVTETVTVMPKKTTEKPPEPEPTPAPQTAGKSTVTEVTEITAKSTQTTTTEIPAPITEQPTRSTKNTKDTEQAKAERKQKFENKKLLFTQENLEPYLRNYLIETASCFLMDRDKYIDYFGIAPYNKITIKPSKVAGVPDEVVYSMSATKPKLYKFCSYLVDMERFITHEQLYHNFISSMESGKSLVRISEQLHKLYRKLYKGDFVNNLANKEDFDNLLLLVSNNYILGNNDFRSIFTRIPFDIPNGLTEDNIVNYLSNPALREKFTEAFPNYGDIGFDSVFDAIYICFINSIKNKLSTDQIESAVLTDNKRISKILNRKDKLLTKQLSKKKIA